jgi:hypothetical protein
VERPVLPRHDRVVPEGAEALDREREVERGGNLDEHGEEGSGGPATRAAAPPRSCQRPKATSRPEAPSGNAAAPRFAPKSNRHSEPVTTAPPLPKQIVTSWPSASSRTAFRPGAPACHLGVAGDVDDTEQAAARPEVDADPVRLNVARGSP